MVSSGCRWEKATGVAVAGLEGCWMYRCFESIASDETPEVEATPKINGGTRRDIYIPQYRIGNPPCMILCSSKTYSSKMIIDANDIQNSSDP